MFVHKNQLAYQLTPEDYYSEKQHNLELEYLFMPGWHLVGIKQDLSKEGDYKTLELLGKPILIHNSKGNLYAYLNVCSHRHSMLTHQTTGCFQKITCQYHGWEYESSGKVCKMPDGACFKPFDKENSSLIKYQLETCGDLIFVNLSKNTLTLKEYLGDYYDLVNKKFCLPSRSCWRWQKSFDCNWKLPVENTLETYHLHCMHQKSLAEFYPTEKQQTHDLNDKYTTLRYDLDKDNKTLKLQNWALKILGGGNSDYTYIHHHIHPNLVFTFTDLFFHAQVYLPVSPTQCKTEIVYYSFKNKNNNPVNHILSKLVARHGRNLNKIIQTEDAEIFEDQQKGIEQSPHSGSLGTREERIYAFQKYIVKKTKSSNE